MPHGSVCFVDDLLELLVDLLAVAQQIVQVGLAEGAAQRGLRDLRRRLDVVRHLRDGVVGVDHAEVDHRVDLDGDVVAGDDLLRRHLMGDGAQVDARHAVDEGNDEEQARALGPLNAAQAEDDAALVLLDDFDRRCGDHESDDEDDDDVVHILLVWPRWGPMS